ncbi:MAG: acylneuraminate cytidylyltransferase family protein [Bacteroidales bacterium]|nr:acylneuraminate cytidylyltransferase family protein [Lachnoclostridium sp.]MCM1383954.1 acylneuraminate cytidylyltransferase family protein [Lachnoclostridium sp.]MCM1464663.1 acylneuraminate cytidylyltransferase family protein [Bacteroidales bacterium]
MNILVTICARAGSKGVKSKNTRMFCGYPLVYYTLSAYQLFTKKYGSEYDSIQLAINTDSEALVEQMNQSGIAYTHIVRKEELAGDRVAKISVIRDTLQRMEEKENITYGAVLDLDLTSPLRTIKDVKGTLDALLQRPGADIAFSVTRSRRSPYFNMVCEKEDGFFNTVISSNFVARQQTPVCFDMNASIYAYEREYLLSGRNQERKAVIWTMEDRAVLDIDSEDDYELMGLLEAHYIKRDTELREVSENRKRLGETC